MIAFNAALALTCFAAAAGLAYVQEKASDIDTVVIGGAAKPGAQTDEPRNILLVGTDSTEGLAKGDPILRSRDVGGHLADVIMILRIDPATKSAALLSIPRDTWVPVAPRWSTTKINSALTAPDGETALIATIKQNFGISIDNYVEVNFAGFRELVDVLGGVPVYLSHPVRDRNTALWLPQTGCIVIDPTQALAYARSRHLEYQSGDVYDSKAKWIKDDTNDLGRMTRQQDFLQRAAEQAVDRGIRNPTTALGLINAGVDAVKKDENLNVGQIQDLISLFRNFNVDSLERYSLPTSAGGSLTTVAYEKVVWSDAQPILARFRPDDAAANDPSGVIVGVDARYRGADLAAASLESSGFDADVIASSGSSRRSQNDTVVSYGPAGVDAALLVASYVEGDVTFEFAKDLRGPVVELILGADATIVDKPVGRSSATDPTVPTTTSKSTTSAPDSSQDPATGDDDGATNPGSAPPEGNDGASPLDIDASGTTIGFVPIDAEASAQCS